MRLVLTCEHAGNEITEDFQVAFEPYQAELNTHRGLDLGALDVFESLKPLASFHLHETASRLLIELNRSLHHKDLFSRISKTLDAESKETLINTIYKPFRNRVEEKISNYLTEGKQVFHLSIHSFTPVMNGTTRHCDLGILYDPKRKKEKDFAKKLKEKVLENSDLNVRFNYPYKGSSDGFTTYLRKRFPNNYLGIELEINQKFSHENHMEKGIKDIIYKAVQSLKTTP